MSVNTMQRPEFEKETKESIVSRVKNSPYIIGGMSGWVLAMMYGAYRYKTHGTKTKLSLYLIQLRVAAQGIVVGACTVGVAYSLYRDFIKKPAEIDDKPLH